MHIYIYICIYTVYTLHIIDIYLFYTFIVYTIGICLLLHVGHIGLCRVYGRPIKHMKNRGTTTLSSPNGAHAMAIIVVYRYKLYVIWLHQYVHSLCFTLIMNLFKFWFFQFILKDRNIFKHLMLLYYLWSCGDTNFFFSDELFKSTLFL